MSSKDNINESEKPLDNAKEVLKFSSDRQKKIWRALAKLHPKFGKKIASIFEGIILALNDNNPEKISIVSHLARELTEVLPIYISGIPIRQKRATDDEIKKGLNNILKILKSGKKSDEKIKEVVENLIAQIPEQKSQREQLRKIVDSHKVLGSRPSYLNDEFIKQWMIVNRYFLKYCHHSELKNLRDDPFSEAELNANLNTFEVLIYRILVKEPFFDTMKEIDRLMGIDNPIERDADELMRHIVEPQHRRYFFERCDNPNWLNLLNKRNAFSSPQEPLKKDGYIQFIPWPESKYLVRVAHKKPLEVYKIIEKLTSDNQTVLYDFLKAALDSPVNISAMYANLIVKKKWLQGPYNLSLPDQVADLMEKLAKGKKGKEALCLANELFRLRIDKQRAPKDRDELRFFHPDAKPYYDEWQFKEIVGKKTKELAKIKPKELFNTYIQKLKEAIELEKRGNKDGNFYEYSHIWRPNLSISRNKTEDAKNILLDGIIQLIEQYKNDPVILKQFSVALRKYSYALFRRIEMFLYKFDPNIFTKESENILRNRRIIIAYNLRREYLPLLEIMYDKISTSSKKYILKVIEGGPDFKKPKDYTDEQFERMTSNWKSLYLSPIKDKLSKGYSDKYSKIIKKYGKPIDDDGEMTVWDGGKSPISAEDLSKLDADETLKYLADYKMPDDPFGRHSSSGLGMIFSGLVAENPEKYVPTAKNFFERKTRPIYFYHLIHGLRESLVKKKCFSWKPIIELCYRIVVKKEYNSEPVNNDEQDWNSVRLAIADFLGRALGDDTCEIPTIFRKEIWDIVSNLAEDQDPTPEYEHKDSEGGLDPMTLAINTVRGEAMHAVVNYGLWIARNLPDKSIEVKMPEEMEELLNKHLDIKQDPSLAIRSVYGWRLPNLHYLNKPWIEKNKEKIFAKDSPDYLLAAWEGYLANNILKEVFSILKQQYYDFIPYLGTLEKKGYRAADIDQRFPQHVAVIYANEPEHEDFVDYFFKTAPVKTRAEAINFIGRVILRQLEAFPNKEEVKKRLGNLWDKRISLSEEQTETEELKEFGWWFKVSPFPKKETLERTIKTLKLIKGVINVPYEIAEELKIYAKELPVETITLLDLIVRAERENYEHLYKKEEYREVIKIVKATGNKTANKIVKDLINYLGSIGLIDDFRDLL